MFVTDPEGRLLGVLTERDIFGRLVSPDVDLSQPVERLMVDHPNTLHLDEPIRRAIELMQTGRFRNVPLVDDDGVLVGVVRPVDVLKYARRGVPRGAAEPAAATAPAHGRDRGRMSTEAPPQAASHRPRSSSSGSPSASPAIPATACSSPASQFTRTAAAFGNDISTYPDFPAEIRAPAGSLPGVSGFQLSFSSTEIHTPGDAPDVLVAMNPAALKANLGELPAGGALIVNEDAFTAQNLAKVGYASNPLSDGSLKQWNVFNVPISTLNSRALEGLGLTNKQVDLTKNFFALGPHVLAVRARHGRDDGLDRRQVLEAARDRRGQQARPEGRLQLRRDDRDLPRALHRPAGQARARATTGTSPATRRRPSASSRPRSSPSGDLFYGSYPITPASDILHQLAGYKNFGVKTFQAEDEIAAIGAAIGASYGGAMGMTASSGPGIALKSEALGLAVMVELPLVVVDVQRAGPSTGMPTKNEQADLLQVMFGRNSDSPGARSSRPRRRASASTTRSRRGGSRSST